MASPLDLSGGRPGYVRTLEEIFRGALARQYPKGVEENRYGFHAEELGSVTRLTFWDRVTNEKRIADLRMGEMLGATGDPILKQVFHGQNEAPIYGQVAWDEKSRKFRYSSPADILARGFVQSILSGKSLVRVLSEGTEEIAPHAYKEDDDWGYPVAGKLSGIAPYADDSLARKLSSSVTVLYPEFTDVRQRNEQSKILQEQIMYGDLGRLFPGYTRRTHGSIERIVPGAFDPFAYARVVDSEGRVQAYGQKFYGMLEGAKEVKHGLAGVGPSRERAYAVDDFLKPLAPGKFTSNIEEIEPGLFGLPKSQSRYIETNAFGPWQSRGDPDLNISPGKLRTGLLNLSFIPTATPHTSGSIFYTDFEDIPERYAITTPDVFALEGITGANALLGGKLNLFNKETVSAGRGKFRFGKFTSEDKEIDLKLDRHARGMRLDRSTATLAIAPYYRPGSANLEFAEYDPALLESGEIASTVDLAKQLSEKYGINVVRNAGTTPELRMDVIQEVSAGWKGLSGKGGATRLSARSPLNIRIDDDNYVRVGIINPEVKTMPTLFAETWGAYDAVRQRELVSRLGDAGRQVAQMMEQRWGDSSANLADVADMFTSVVRENYPNLLENRPMAVDLETGRQYPKGYNYVEIAQQILKTFEGKTNLDDLKRYGIAHITEPTLVEGGMLSHEQAALYQATQRAAIEQRLKSGKKIVVGDQTFEGVESADRAFKALFNYTPIKLGDTGARMVHFTYNVNEGWILPQFTNIVPELGGYGSLNYRQISSLSENFPEAAMAMGISADDSPLGLRTTKEKRAWHRIKQWEAYTIARNNDQLITPSPDMVTAVTQEEAGRILRDYNTDAESLKDLSDKERLERFTRVMQRHLGDRWTPDMMFFMSSTNAYMPGPETIANIDKFSDEAGVSMGMRTISYLNASLNLLGVQAKDSVVNFSEATQAARGFGTMMENILSGRGVAKNVFSHDVPTMRFERYVGMTELNMEEVFVPRRELELAISGLYDDTTEERAKSSKETIAAIRRELYSQRFSTEAIYQASQLDIHDLVDYVRWKMPNKFNDIESPDERRLAYYNLANELKKEQVRLASASVGGFAWRQPDVHGSSVLPARIISDQQLAARGMRLPKGKYTPMGVSAGFSIIGVGDLDRDPMQVMLAVDKDGNLIDDPRSREVIAAYKKVGTQWGDALGAPDNPMQVLKEVFGSEAAAYNILQESVSDYLEAQTPGSKKASFRKGMAGSYRDLEAYQKGMTDTGESKRNMGTVYNMQRRLEAANMLLNELSPDEFRHALFNPLQAYYQKAIDMNMGMGSTPAVMNVMSKMSLYESKTGQMRVGTSRYGSDEENELDWISLGDANDSTGRILDTMVMALGAEKELPNSALAYMFAPTSDAFHRNLGALNKLEELKRQDPNRWGNVSRGSVLLGESKVPGFEGENSPQVSELSDYYIASMSNMVYKALDKFEPEKLDKTQIYWRGKMQNIREVAADPYIAGAQIGYIFQTMRHTGIGADSVARALATIRKIYGDLNNPETLDKMPTLARHAVALFSDLLGNPNATRIKRDAAVVEDMIKEVLAEQRQGMYTRAMEMQMTGKVILRPSDVAPWIETKEFVNSGKLKWHPEEKIVGKHALLGERELVGEKDLLDRIYPFAETEQQARDLDTIGNLFEQGWVPNLPGASSELSTVRVGKIPEAWRDESGVLRGGGVLEWTAFGASWRGVPDFLSWDRGTGTFNITELKASRESLYGRYQAALYGKAFHTLATGTAEEQSFLRDWLSSFGQFRPEVDAIVEAMRDPEKIKTWLVDATVEPTVDNVRVHSAPQRVDWQEMTSEEGVVARRATELVANLRNPEYVKRILGEKIIPAAEQLGLDMTVVREFAGEFVKTPKPERRKAIPTKARITIAPGPGSGATPPASGGGDSATGGGGDSGRRGGSTTGGDGGGGNRRGGATPFFFGDDESGREMFQRFTEAMNNLAENVGKPITIAGKQPDAHDMREKIYSAVAVASSLGVGLGASGIPLGDTVYEELTNAAQQILGEGDMGPNLLDSIRRAYTTDPVKFSQLVGKSTLKRAKNLSGALRYARQNLEMKNITRYAPDLLDQGAPNEILQAAYSNIYGYDTDTIAGKLDQIAMASAFLDELQIEGVEYEDQDIVASTRTRMQKMRQLAEISIKSSRGMSMREAIAHKRAIARSQAGLSFFDAQDAYLASIKGMYSALGDRAAGIDVSSLESLENAMTTDGTLSVDQRKAIFETHKALVGVKTAKAAYDQVESPEKLTTEDVERFQRVQSALKGVREEFDKFIKETEGGKKTFQEVSATIREITAATAKTNLEKVGAEISQVIGGRVEEPSKMLERLRAERAGISARIRSGEGTTDDIAMVETLDQLEDKYKAASQQLASAESDRTVAARESGLGGFARRMLGGFGLMYLRSIAGIIAGPLQKGYAESLAYQQAADASTLSVLGAGSFRENPEESVQRATALYGGGMWRVMRQEYARVSETSPGLMNLFGGFGSGIGAFGLMSYGLGALGVAPAVANPISVGIAALVGTAAFAGNVYGAYANPEKSAVSTASRMFSNAYDTLTYSQIMAKVNNVPMQNVMYGPDGRPVSDYTRNPIFDAQLAATVKDPQALNDLRAYIEMREYADSGKSIADALDKMGIVDPAERQRLVAGYSESTLNKYKNIPSEGIFGYTALAAKYGISAPEGVSATEFEQTMMARIASGTDYEGIAKSLAASTGLGYDKAISMIAPFIQKIWNKDPSKIEALLSGAEAFSRYAHLIYPQASVEGYLGIYEKFSQMNAAGSAIFARRAGLYERGMFTGSNWAMPDYNDQMFYTMTPSQYKEQMVSVMRDEYSQSLKDQYAQILMSTGITSPADLIGRNWDDLKLRVANRVGTAINNIADAAVASGWVSQGYAETWAQDMHQRDPSMIKIKEMNMLQRAIQGDKFALTFMQANGMQLLGKDIPFYKVGDVDLSGQATGQQLWTTSMNIGNPLTGGISGAQVMSALLGDNWRSWGPSVNGRSFVDAMVNGVRIGNFNDLYGRPLTVGGTMALSYMQSQLSYQNAMASVGNAMAGWNLNYAFTTGVGLSQYAGIINPQTGQPFNFNTGQFRWSVNGDSYRSPGGGLWGLQDAMRNLGYSQQMWGFEVQERQMNLQSAQFYENLQMNMRQSAMQRGWTREDWAFQDTQRNLNWQWQVEDFQEEVRFMTGRQRRKAERQMDRATIAHGMEGEQIDKQRERQEELWRLEDDRFEMQRDHHEQQLQMQKENLKVTQEYFEERKRLEEEQIKLQRAQWTEQMKLQRESIGLQAKAAKDAKELQELQIAMQLAQMELNRLEETKQISSEKAAIISNQMMDNFIKKLGDAGALIRDLIPGGGGGGSTPRYDPNDPWDGNGPLPPGESGWGDGGGDGGGDRPHPTSYNPWAQTVVYSPYAKEQTQEIKLNLYIGDKYLGEFVIDTVNANLEV